MPVELNHLLSWVLHLPQNEEYLRKYEQQGSCVMECSWHKHTLTHTHTRARARAREKCCNMLFLLNLVVVELVFTHGNMLYVIRHADANVFQ